MPSLPPAAPFLIPYPHLVASTRARCPRSQEKCEHLPGIEILYIIDTGHQTKDDCEQTMGWTQRQINTFLFILILTGALVALIGVLTLDVHPMTRIGYAVGALCVVGGLLIAYRRGWEYARHTLALAITLAVAFFTNEPHVSQQMDLVHAVPMVVALVLTGPRSNCVACQGALVCTAGSQGFC